MKLPRAVGWGLFSVVAILCCRSLFAQTMNTSIVHIAELEIDPAQIESFKSAATDNISSTLKSEPDILEFHAVIKRGLPGRVVVFEAYASQQAYESHIQSPQ
jgi:quinol monooxygenase YgiN